MSEKMRRKCMKGAAHMTEPFGIYSRRDQYNIEMQNRH